MFARTDSTRLLTRLYVGLIIGIAVIAQAGCGDPTPTTSTRLALTLVCDPAQQDCTDAQNTLSKMNYNVSVQSSLASTPTGDVLVLLPSGQVSPSDADTVRSYLRGGKGIILISSAPENLVTGVVPKNLKPIGDFFGNIDGIMGPFDFGGPAVITPSRPNQKFDAGIPGAQQGIIAQEFDVGSGSLGPGTDIVLAAVPNPLQQSGPVYAFAFTPQIGGRVFWLATLGIKTADHKAYPQGQGQFFQNIFARAAVWAAGK